MGLELVLGLELELGLVPVLRDCAAEEVDTVGGNGATSVGGFADEKEAEAGAVEAVEEGGVGSPSWLSLEGEMAAVRRPGAASCLGRPSKSGSSRL
jgi:hypothetical protein